MTERHRNQMKQEQQETIEQQPQLEDLTVDETKTETVKGGPGYITDRLFRTADIKGEAD